MYYYKKENGFECRNIESLDPSMIEITEKEYNIELEKLMSAEEENNE